MSIVGCPLVKDEDNKVSKEGGHENHFWDKSKVYVQWLLKIATGKKRKRKFILDFVRIRAKAFKKRVFGTTVWGLGSLTRAGSGAQELSDRHSSTQSQR